MPTTLPFSLSDTSQVPDYGMTLAERALADFTDIELWFQFGGGSVVSPPPNFILRNRLGTQHLRAIGSDLILNQNLAESVDVGKLPGGNLASQQPLHVPNYFMDGSYFVAILVKFGAAADMSAVQHFFAAGVAGSATALQCYQSNGTLFLKHGSNNNTQAGMFVQGQEYLILVTYDAVADLAKGYVNSLTPVAWGGSENVTGTAGGDRDLTFGARWDAAKDSADQVFDGSIRAMWVGKAPWGASSYDDVRSTFLQRVADLYADITLA